MIQGFTPRTYHLQIDHDLDRLLIVPHLPFRERDVQDLHARTTDPTGEVRPTVDKFIRDSPGNVSSSCRSYMRTRSGIDYLSVLNDLDHELWESILYLSEV